MEEVSFILVLFVGLDMVCNHFYCKYSVLHYVMSSHSIGLTDSWIPFHFENQTDTLLWDHYIC